MRKLKIVFTAIFLISVVTGLITKRHALACETVRFSNYTQLTPNTFASPSVENLPLVLKSISEGKNRVNSTFGNMIATPKVILVGSKDEAAQFGANSTATAHYTPIGTCIVLGPKGQNVDVAAHELTHAEIWGRVGWLAHWVEIPVWFNEGVALIVDHREPFLLENIRLNQQEVEAVKELETGDEFFGGRNTHKNYLASRRAVKDIEPLRLYQKLALIRNGESFESVFKM